MMACFNQNPSENVVSSAFSEAKTFFINNKILTLYDEKGAAVVTLTLGQPSIIGSYKIISINGLSTLELNKVDVTITEDSIQYRYCNGKRLSYTTNDNNIDIKSGISTLMFCSDLNPS
jgi:heat shock protein HslJ